MNIRACNFECNKVIILAEKTMHVTELEKEDVKNIDAFIDYSKRSYNNEVAYTKYIIKEKYLDSNNNLLLICDEEYYPNE